MRHRVSRLNVLNDLKQVLSSRCSKYFLIPFADRLVVSPYIENVGCAHVLAFEQLALGGFDFVVGRHAIGGDDDLLAFFGQEKVHK